MTNKSTFFILFLIAIAFTIVGTSKLGYAQDAKKISVEQVCESYMDKPLAADSIYKGKAIQTTIKPEMVRKIYSLCPDAPQGTFTVEFVTKSERVVQCFCNAPDQKSVLDTPKGTNLNIEGIYKSMTASFFESMSKQCTITIQNCTFN